MRFTVDSNGCWNFSGAIGSDGYGKISLKKMTFRAHRLMAHITIKPMMSDSEIVAHRCDNPRCINPDHLFITSPLGNMQDRDRKGRGSHGERCKLSKLNAEQVLDIRKKYSEGMSYSKIAALYPIISIGNVQAIVERRTWKHL